MKFPFRDRHVIDTAGDRHGSRAWPVGQENTLYYTFVKNKPRKEIYASLNFARSRSRSTLTFLWSGSSKHWQTFLGRPMPSTHSEPSALLEITLRQLSRQDAAKEWPEISFQFESYMAIRGIHVSHMTCHSTNPLGNNRDRQSEATLL